MNGGDGDIRPRDLDAALGVDKRGMPVSYFSKKKPRAAKPKVAGSGDGAVPAPGDAAPKKRPRKPRAPKAAAAAAATATTATTTTQAGAPSKRRVRFTGPCIKAVCEFTGSAPKYARPADAGGDAVYVFSAGRWEVVLTATPHSRPAVRAEGDASVDVSYVDAATFAAAAGVW